MTVTVVPILRLRRATAGWSYRVPRGKLIGVGSLVVIPFRGRPTLGVVWETSEQHEATEEITEILTHTPLVREPQRRLIEWMALEGLVSLSTALYMWLPAALRGLPLTKPVRQAIAAWDETQPSAKTLATRKQHCVLVPSRRPQAEHQLHAKYGEHFHVTFADTTPAQEFAAWLAVAQGKTAVLTGRERALYAPWINLRHCTVIEPEDISFHTSQAPSLNLVHAAMSLAGFSTAELTLLSNVPPEASQQVWQDINGWPIPPVEAELTDLTRERLISDKLIQCITDTGAAGKSVIILYNAHDRLLPQEDGSRTIIPGIETVSKQLATAFGQTQLPAFIQLGTRAMLTDLPRGVGLSILLSLDPLLAQPSIPNQLHGWGDIGKLLRLGAPLIVQTKQPGHPLAQALLKGRFAEYCTEALAEAREAGLAPFAEEIICSTGTAETTPSPEKLYDKLQALAPTPWRVGYPRSAKRRGKERTIITLVAPLGSRIPHTLYRELASLSRPWQVERGSWYS
jgi:primosomal protein N'